MASAGGRLRLSFWACPECVGDIETSVDSATVRCIGCGRTEVQWARRFPRKKIIMGTIFPDALYARDTTDAELPDCTDE